MNAKNNKPHKDLFSDQAGSYSKFRPGYPADLFQYLKSVAPGYDLAWDAGTGSGQAASQLARDFKRVVATDISEKQMAQAPVLENVEYCLSSAEQAPLRDASADLVTVAQAFHWFKQSEFFAEASRVLKPRGVLAIWGYGLATISPDIDSVVLKLYRDILGPHWEPERKMVDEGYRDVRLPFVELTAPAVEMSAKWSVGHLLGYLGTWSALQTYAKKNGSNPLESIGPELRAAWGDDEIRRVRWPLSLRVGRK